MGRPLPGVLSLGLYPNPVTDVMTVEVKQAYAVVDELFVINSDGELLRNINANLEVGESLEIDVSGLVEGVYFLGARTGVGVKYERFVVLE